MVKKLIKYSKGYRLLSVITPILVVMESFIEIYIPYVMADLIDQGIYGGNMNAVAKYGLFLIGAALVSLAFGVAAGITAPFASAGFASNLRRAMFDKVQEYDFQSIDKFSTPSIVTRLTTDVTNVQQAYQMIIRISARAPSMLILALIAAYRVNHELSRVFLVAIPMLAVGVAVLMISVHPIFKKVFKKYDEMNGVVQESVRGIRVVKSFNRQDFEIDKFKTSSGTIFDLFSKAEKRMAWMAPIVQFTSYTIMILLCWIGGRMIVASGNDAAFGLTTGELMSMVTYTTQILMSLMMLSMIFLQLTMARESGARIVAILDETSGINDPEDPIMEVKDGSIDFDGVSFSYSHKDEDALLTEGEHSIGRLALDSVDLHIKSGQTVGILGGTGSSKSTLVQLIPRLYDVSSGSVKVGGVDVRDYNITVLRDKVAMVLQKNVLFSGTISENLLWGNENATDEEIRHALKVSCSDEFVNKLPDGIETVLDQGGT
ncbi:MAG: ABC transporter ATP-binding protein, partial [Firmicutes bacterium]|nr:ABC transporter ATP-binding protein [Bacillota bacterium]